LEIGSGSVWMGGFLNSRAICVLWLYPDREKCERCPGNPNFGPGGNLDRLQWDKLHNYLHLLWIPPIESSQCHCGKNERLFISSRKEHRLMEWNFRLVLSFIIGEWTSMVYCWHPILEGVNKLPKRRYLRGNNVCSLRLCSTLAFFTILLHSSGAVYSTIVTIFLSLKNKRDFMDTSATPRPKRTDCRCFPMQRTIRENR
jgi:hypothetical protein